MFAYGATGSIQSRFQFSRKFRIFNFSLKKSCFHRYKGSGKTFTMIGNEQTGPGVMVLAMRDLFQQIEVIRKELLFF